ncbi:MAG TPA: serine hydrolase domain-containing protein [Longimicrobium sp.]|nr:serine hydrolase domain-containing protein [Longimicrobium sp.]
MSRLTFAASALALTVLLEAACERSPTSAAGSCDARFLPLVERMDSLVAVRRLPGAAIYLSRGDDVLCDRAVGGYGPDEVVPIASASKWLTAATLLNLVDEGRVELDAPVSARLPGFEDDKAAITLRQLLSHTSGIERGDLCVTSRFTTLEECAAKIAQAPLDYVPGREFRYAGASFTVAGRLAEVAAGKTWAELFDERIRRPLEMETTEWPDTRNPTLSTAAWSSARDYAKLLRMIADGGSWRGRRILSPAAIAEMTRDEVGTIPMTRTPRLDSRGYGLGMWRDEVGPGGRALRVSGVGASGFLPWIDFERDLVGVIVIPPRDGDDVVWYRVATEMQAEIRQLVPVR